MLIPAILVRCAFDSRHSRTKHTFMCQYIAIHMYNRVFSCTHSVYIADRLCFLPSSCLLPFAIFHFSFFFLTLCVYVYIHCTPFPLLFRTCSFQNGSNAVCAYRLNSLFQIFERKFVSENCSDYPFTACTIHAMIHVPCYIIFRTIECVERPNSHQFDMPLVNIYMYIRYIDWCRLCIL